MCSKHMIKKMCSKHKGSLFNGNCTLSPNFKPKMHQNVILVRCGLNFVNIIQNQCKLGQICSVSTMRESLGENYDHIASDYDAIQCGFKFLDL